MQRIFRSQSLFICLKSRHDPGKKILFGRKGFLESCISSVWLKKEVSLQMRTDEYSSSMLQKLSEITVSLQLHPFENALLPMQLLMEQWPFPGAW